MTPKEEKMALAEIGRVLEEATSVALTDNKRLSLLRLLCLTTIRCHRLLMPQVPVTSENTPVVILLAKLDGAASRILGIKREEVYPPLTDKEQARFRAN